MKIKNLDESRYVLACRVLYIQHCTAFSRTTCVLYKSRKPAKILTLDNFRLLPGRMPKDSNANNVFQYEVLYVCCVIQSTCNEQTVQGAAGTAESRVQDLYYSIVQKHGAQSTIPTRYIERHVAEHRHCILRVFAWIIQIKERKVTVCTVYTRTQDKCVPCEAKLISGSETLRGDPIRVYQYPAPVHMQYRLYTVHGLA